MKKTNSLALLMAIALASTFSLSACSSSDEVTSDNAEPNPTYDGTSVRTDFAFNITKASQTRMTAANTQNNNNFRGMQDMYLYAMKTADTSTEPNGEEALQTYALKSIAANKLDDNASTTQTPSSKVYPLSIPVGTNNFLFYARALRGEGTNFQLGKVTDNLSPSSKITNNITFSLASIEEPTGVDATRAATEQMFADYLNSIAGAKDGSNNLWSETPGKATTDGRYSAIAKLYNDFARPDLNTGEVRSGSAESIKRTVRDLYTSMKGIVSQSDENASVQEKEINDIAEAVCTAIVASVFNLNAPASGLPNQNNPYSIDWKEGVSTAAKTYPASYDLPMGASQLGWNSTANKIEYVNFEYSSTVTSTSTTFSGVPTANITYPAELLYYDNSPLIGTDQYKTVAQYPVTTVGWNTLPGGTSEDGTKAFDASWTQTEVQPTTRAVAMRNNVNYGVAMLESTVRVKDGVTQLEDNQQSIIGTAQDQSFTISDMNAGQGLQLTGILIGGQPASINGKMLPASTETFEYAIYDKDLREGGQWEINKNTNVLETLYTVCFDNFKSGGTQSDVCVALEFKNNLGRDFYGAKNLIPEGSTFYLVGKLAPNATSGVTDTWNSTYPAGYRVSESSTKRVFGQDHKTIANFYLTGNSLKSAYSTVPDLRSTEMLFGLSVDLTWQSGLTFNVEM